MSKRVFALTVFFLAIFLSLRVSVAQEVNATLTGTVTDATGAVVQGATVVVHNNETNTEVRTVSTDASGSFTITNLPAAGYTITVKSPGFRSYIANNVVLHVAEKRTIDAQLRPGEVTENVTVTESTNPVQTSTAAQAGTITGTQVRELELNNRNFEQLVTLQPGVVSGLPDVVGFGISNTSTVVVNGARASANNWTVDGSDVNDSGSNSTLLNVPSVDAIQEFTLQRSTYDAQYGRSGGGQVIVATKSGTNQFHGDAYEFVRNDFFNANDFFANSSGTPRAPERYNNFGFTIGGPLFIPKLYKKSQSKTFFFWSEEWRKEHLPATDIATVPTAAQLAGTFAGTTLNPASAPAGCITNTAAGGQINPACFSQNAKAYISNIYSRFPANATAGTQYITNVVSLNNYRQDLVRLDQNISDRIHLFGRFMQDVVPTTEPGGLFAGNPLPGISSTSTNAPGKNVVANMSWTISPTVVNEAAFNYSWGAINSNITGIVNSPSFVGGLAGGLPYSDPYGRVPGVNVPGGEFTGLAIPVSPYFERNIDENFYDNFSKVLGSHSIRAGVSVQWMGKTENAVNPTNGTFTFRAANGNPAFANFLLGNASLFTQSSRDIVPYLHYFNFEAFVQDDWKVTPKLTLNLGMRYSYFPTPQDSHHVLNNFDPLVYNPALAPAIDPATGDFVAGQAAIPATYTNGIIFPTNACAGAKAISPGVTCSPYGNLVNPNSNNNFGPRVGFAWDPIGNGKTAIRAGYGVYFDRTLNGIWEQNAFSDPPLVQQVQITNTSFDHPTAGIATVPLGPISITATGNPTFKVPSYQDWNFSMQQQIHPNTTFEIAYVGTKGTHLLGEVDANQPFLGVRQANPTVDVNSIRPFLGYAGFYDRIPQFDSNYNSLQVSLNRHVTQGLNVGIAYTWSKNLTDNTADRGAPVYNTYNFRQNYGPAFLNTPHIFVANYVYDLPFFKDQKGLIGHVLGGWELSGITTVESGQSLSITQSNDPFNSGDFAGVPGTYPGGIGIDFNNNLAPRADIVPGASVSGAGTLTQWMNTAAFTPAIGHFGTAGPGLILGPGLQNWDVAAIRNFKIGERMSLQFRGEFFNVFNHVNFNSVDTNVSSPTFGRLNGDHLPRNIQLGAKLYF
jgi:hypothetical protein